MIPELGASVSSTPHAQGSENSARLNTYRKIQRNEGDDHLSHKLMTGSAWKSGFSPRARQYSSRADAPTTRLPTRRNITGGKVEDRHVLVAVDRVPIDPGLPYSVSPDRCTGSAI